MRAGDPATVFYSGLGAAGADQVSSKVLRLTADANRGFDGHWVSSTKCDPSQAVKAVPASWHGEPIDQLAGYSLGRIGPVYFLLQTFNTDHARWSQIRYVLLIDPGARADFEGASHIFGLYHSEASCDVRDDVAPWTVVEDWLASNPKNQLTILAGTDSASEDHYTIKQYYLRSAGGLRKQVLVCDTGLDHEATMSTYKDLVGAPPQPKCPKGSNPWGTELPTPKATPAPQPTPAAPHLSVNGACTSNSGTLTGASSGFTAGGTATIRAWYPDGHEYTNLVHSARVRADGSIPWTWPCVGDPAGAYTTEATDDASGSSTGKVSFTIGSAQPPPLPVNVDAYSNYGPANAGRAMCRGNPGRPESMPGGTVSQSFAVPPGVASINTALVQIDPDAAVTAHATLLVNGAARASSGAAASGDTRFNFPAVGVASGDQMTLSINFTAASGKIITVYTAGSPVGTFTTSNSCSDGAPSVSLNTTGLRAVVSGLSG